MSKTSHRDRWAALLVTTVVGALGATTHAAEFQSAWPGNADRIWAGPQYWANRLQDWRVTNGRLECITSGGDRNVHLLTHEVAAPKGDLRISVRLGRLDPTARLTPGWAGFRVGIKGQWGDYRDNARRGKGLDAGLTTQGELFIGSAKSLLPTLAHRGIARTGWKVHHVSSQETQGENSRARNAFDGRPNTIWHTRWKSKKAQYPHELQIDLGRTVQVCGFCYLPRQPIVVGRIKDYEFYVSMDGKTWGDPVKTGAFPNSAELQEVTFPAKAGRTIRLVANSGIMDRPACVVAEFYVLDPATRTKGTQPKPSQPVSPIPLDDVQLRLSAEPDGERYTLTLAAHDPKTGTRLGQVTQPVAPDQLAGTLALVCNASLRGRRGQRSGGNVRLWFRDWQVAGSKVEAHPERAFGPILWAQHTLAGSTLTLTAQMPPLGPNDAQTVRLQVQKGNNWTTVATAPIHPLARTATFRIRNWDASRDWPYRVAYAFAGPDGTPTDHTWGGTIRKDPADKPTIVVAAFTGNADYAFPNLDLVRHVTAHNPDLLFFSGDNIYENVGGYGCQRAPLDQAVLDYLRKWYFFGWAYASLLRDRPCISIPDDHDVYQGNLWGHGGRKTPNQNAGGYTMPAEWVKTVERTQTSNLPPPFDPTPIGQGIGVYYTQFVYGRISFAVIEDRKFKTGPQGLVPKTRSGRSDHVANGGFDPKAADVPAARMLGERQLKFVRTWATDWRGADMKCALSQTTFCNAATLHGAGLRRLVADYDSNGWPQTGRNKAVHELRRGFAFHIGGDQHLATIVHHGIHAWNDATWSFCVPSVANFYPRAWVPLKPAHNWKKGMIEHTGQFHDGFGNLITLHAHTNPRPMGKQPASIHDKMPGYGIVRFHKPTRAITMECWPLFADPRDPKTGGQYEGWPKTIHQTDCYGRAAAAWLPTLRFTGKSDPVVQIIDETDGDVVYTLRVSGDSFRPKVFRPGAYTVRVGDPPRVKTLKGIRTLAPGKKGTLRIDF